MGLVIYVSDDTASSVPTSIDRECKKNPTFCSFDRSPRSAPYSDPFGITRVKSSILILGAGYRHHPLEKSARLVRS
ncbi:hypothetical protein M407DRAFT_114724 [Tulasnella calospora MUT 4182]|uniref:Uncharacterized protein n=1 Tax=Tulasnella calospora MUT 4182 TaxID=1051891 RepID=A0A0C3KND7_9AGAM|nr:hypothetical protein M407DRAFT_114724 [Tulasnella calospora MUT 4182]